MPRATAKIAATEKTGEFRCYPEGNSHRDPKNTKPGEVAAPWCSLCSLGRFLRLKLRPEQPAEVIRELDVPWPPLEFFARERDGRFEVGLEHLAVAGGGAAVRAQRGA